MVRSRWSLQSAKSDRLLAQMTAAGFLAGVALLVGGCDSRQRVPEAPGPEVKDGRPPGAPELGVTARPIFIPPSACAVVATSSTDEGVAPLTVQFFAEGVCTGSAGAFTWNFGDGSAPSRGKNPIHVYVKPGSYTARVTLADNDHSASDSDEAPVTVTAP
jgi:hypothetical protein